MSNKSVVLEVDDPHLTIKLYDDILELDLKGSLKDSLIEALENKPVAKETIGKVLGIFVPLHIHLSDIDSVHLDEDGKINLNLTHHRKISLPVVNKEDSENLYKKLNELTTKALDEKIKEDIARRRAKRAQERKSRENAPSSYNTVPYYFPTEQIDIVDKFKWKRNRKNS